MQSVPLSLFIYSLFTPLYHFFLLLRLYFQCFTIASALLHLIHMLDCLYYSPLPPRREEHLDWVYLHAALIRWHTHTRGQLIKGIDPLNLYELQFVPAPHPVRHVSGYESVCVLELLERKKPRAGSGQHLWQAVRGIQYTDSTSNINTCRLACTHTFEIKHTFIRHNPFLLRPPKLSRLLENQFPNTYLGKVFNSLFYWENCHVAVAANSNSLYVHNVTWTQKSEFEYICHSNY